MRVGFTLAEHINVPAGILYDTLTNIRAFEKWKPNYIGNEVLSGFHDLVDEYSMWRERRMVNGKESSDVFEVVDMIPGTLIKLRINGWKGTSRRGEYFYNYHLIENNHTTDLILKHEIVLDGIYGLFAKLLLRYRKKEIQQELKRLKEYTEEKYAKKLERNSNLKDALSNGQKLF